MEELLNWDKSLLFFFNRQLQHDTLDPIVFMMSTTDFWAPLYLAMIYLIFKKKENSAWYYFLAIAFGIACADQLTSSLLKPLVSRLRPTHDPAIQSLIHIVNGYRGGRYGFASSHAANTFAVATFLWYSFRGEYRYISLLFAWATLVSLTRIYLGVHYPSDILAGAIIGILCGYGSHNLRIWLPRLFRKKPFKRENYTGA